jgi:hypothetical protein
MMHEIMLGAVNFAAWGIIQWAIAVVVVAGVIGIVVVCLKQFGLEIPAFVKLIFWICLCVVIGVVAIKFVASLM